MMEPGYRSVLTKEEQLTAIRLGIASEFASTVCEKRAQLGSASQAALNAAKTIAAVSVLFGLPIGTVAHAIGKSNKVSDNKERDALNRIKQYRNAAQDIKGELSAGRL